MTSAQIRIQLPFHLQRLSGAADEVTLSVPAPQTKESLLRALEERYPTLRGTVIDHHSGQRRPKVRFFACRRDLSFTPLSEPLPAEVIAGDEPFMIVGAISGG